MTVLARLKAFPWWRWLLLAALTALATVALDAFAVPSPALFAGLVVATVLALCGLGPKRVARPLTSSAQAVLGVVIGLLASPETLAAVGSQWLPVVLISVATLLVSMAAGLLMGLQRGVSPLTGMLAQTAGGASGLVAISRELGGDERMVAVIQYLRVGLVTISMPVVAGLAYGAQQGGDAVPQASGPGAPWWVGLAVTAVCVAVGLPLGRLSRIPAGSLLVTMTVALIVSLTGLSFGAEVPAPLVVVTYAIIAWQAGLRFTREALGTVVRVLPLATALILAVVAACAGLGLLLSHFTGATLLEGYLATTPGGVYAVLAVAASSGVDVAFVVAVQVFRVILMLMVAPLLARLVSRLLGAGTRA
ncbi:AbrB family transcriptional regulator [Pseudonocardia nematodicida]|uniref:AbrB family transcriptional regulator n=1 Tax=Pseudonocardia nematodicida TaxID=1206997 RepID=A0ABV1K4F7_9PSEU